MEVSRAKECEETGFLAVRWFGLGVFHSVGRVPILVGETEIPQVSWLGQMNERVNTEYIWCTQTRVPQVLAGCCTCVYTCPCAVCLCAHVSRTPAERRGARTFRPGDATQAEGAPSLPAWTLLPGRRRVGHGCQ